MKGMHLRRIGLSTVLRRGALAYLIIWVLSPPLAYGLSWRVLVLLAMALWLAMDLRSPRSVMLRPSWPVLGSVVFVFYTLAIEMLVPDAADINRHFQVWIMLFFLLVGESFRRGREEDARFCFWLTLLVLPVWSLTTLNTLDTYGHAARVVTRSSAEAQELADQGVGGFSLVYAMVLCLPLLAQLVLGRKRQMTLGGGRWRARLGYALLIVAFVLGLLLVMRAGYSIAVLLLGVGLACVLVIRSRRTLPFAISVCFAGLLVFAGSMVLQPTLAIFQNAAVGTEYATKVRDVRASLNTDQSVGTVEGRTERYMRSLRLFLENPVLGTLRIDDVGKHSAVLDRFAQYGIGMGTLFLLLIAYVPWRVLRDRRAPIGMALGFFAVAVGVPLLNNVFMAWGLILYVFSEGALVVAGLSVSQLERTHRYAGVPTSA